MKTFKSPVYLVGAILLLVAIFSSFMLSGTKLGFFESIPGCGVGSGCDAITNGPWGVVPGTSIYVSFIGLAWFVSLLSVFHCCVANNHIRNLFLWSVRVGVLASLGFIVLMIVIGSFCKWCALAHLCNILFWVVCEFWIPKKIDVASTQPKTSSWGFWLEDRHVAWSFWVRFLVLLLIFWNGGRVHAANKLESDALKSAENTEKIVSGGGVENSTLELLEGGHRIGSPDAPIQVVMFTDYQCPDCKRLEGQLANIMKTRDDLSVVVKHFPLNYDCNDQIGTFKLHGNACWAARAAEAAAIVGGQEAWEKMHTWLFSQSGRFTDETFASSLASLGFDAQQIISVMMGDETLQTVKEDAVDGKALGIYFTPMIFINGVEYLWYYGGGKSLRSVIDAVAKSLESGENGVVVAPPDARGKLVDDWRRGIVRNVSGSKGLSWLGDGTIDFVVWGDYQAGLSGVLDEEIKRFINEENTDIRYTFRHFPVDESCNGGVANMPTKYVGSCVLAKLVVAAGALGGDEARWAVHNWIMDQGGDGPNSVDLDAATEFTKTITGVDGSTLNSVLGGIDVNNQMRMDILVKNNVWRKSIPVLLIDNRFVPRWRSDDVSANELFKQIIQSVKTERGEEASK